MTDRNVDDAMNSNCIMRCCALLRLCCIVYGKELFSFYAISIISEYTLRTLYIEIGIFSNLDLC